MYKSPIEIITNEISSRISEAMDGYILRTVQECGVIVDQGELNAALRYDRQQYEKGYADAIAAVSSWLINYQLKTADLKGGYTPYEVLSWVINDWRRTHRL